MHAGDQVVPVPQRLLAHRADDGDEHLLLVGEVAVEDRLGDAGRLGDGLVVVAA